MSDLRDPIRQVRLQFRSHEVFAHVNDPVHKDLSAVARAGDSLFFSCDETAGVDRLTPQADGWGNHAHFGLHRVFDLPGGPGGEMDIEGLEVDGGWLWIVGSHSLKRDKPGEGDDPQAALAELAGIDRDPNRSFLGRVPLVEKDGALAPVARDGERRAASVKLKKWLKGDAHLRPILDLPCKENGLDIEGLAASGLRVWLGLRGPVLRAHATILELQLKLTGKGRLKARRIDGKRRYRKYMVQTRGMGIRDLVRDGDDLLILTGTALGGDGPAEILRWKRALHAEASQLVPEAAIERVLELPYRGAVDHPEGLEALEDGWMVVYDSPAPDRLGPEDGMVLADVFTLD